MDDALNFSAVFFALVTISRIAWKWPAKDARHVR
jgi:hypothetical protein